MCIRDRITTPGLINLDFADVRAIMADAGSALMGVGSSSGESRAAEAAKEEIGALTVGVVTKPFEFEGNRRMQQALDGIDKLRAKVDTLIIVPNQKLLEVVERRTSVQEAFRMADDILRQGVQGITDLITTPGQILSLIHI